jgi:hypothetical protein
MELLRILQGSLLLEGRTSQICPRGVVGELRKAQLGE